MLETILIDIDITINNVKQQFAHHFSQFRFSMTAVLVLEGLLSTLVFLFYTMPEFRRAVKVGPEEVLKKAVKQYFDDEGMKKWIDTVQKEVIYC